MNLKIQGYTIEMRNIKFKKSSPQIKIASNKIQFDIYLNNRKFKWRYWPKKYILNRDNISRQYIFNFITMDYKNKSYEKN